MKNIPVVGNKYHFFDDGKTSNSRHYIAECVEVISFEQADKIIIELVKYSDFDRNAQEFRNKVIYNDTLTNIWNSEKRESDFLFAENTDYFVACKVAKFDDNILWFARTKDGGWFSLDVQSWWQSGRLDVDAEIYNYYVNEYGEDFYTDKI